ncbi:MAG: TonB-dependent receptor, partial [Bacteroidota bacterium]
METKNPFLQRGLSAKIKAGERNLLEGAIRYADHVTNKDGLPFMAYKINFFALRADDWEADNIAQVDSTESLFGNPGGWDKVNTYGDEYFTAADFSDPVNLSTNRAGLETYHRPGYDERDLVDYGTENIKANLALHFRTNPAAEYNSPEFIISSSFGSGTTVYQGDNRFSLRDLLFFQNRLEFRKKDKFFIRAYATHQDAGNSYDPYFTALRLQETAKEDEDWASDYSLEWRNEIYPRMVAMEFPLPSVNPMTGQLIFDQAAAEQWLADNRDSLIAWHAATALVANEANPTINTTQDYFVPGTDRFNEAFDSITSLRNTEGGTAFYDKSALYHIAGEYKFETDLVDEVTVGASGRLYRPLSEGTIFKDTADIRISNTEFGVYTGFKKKFGRQLILTGTMRVDKNENFDALFTPAASIVYSPDPVNYLRFSFSSGIRNPTLTDQYLNLDVGRAILLGNLDGFNDLVTVESLQDYFASNFQDPLDSFNVAPVMPEKVKTFEVGYRTSLFESLYIDASYYYSIYDDFIGFNLGVQATIPNGFTFPTDIQVFRVSANSTNRVTTQGFAIGVNYYFAKYYAFNGNYSWNKLNKSFPDDPIIPAFNTPEHKFNLGISARNLPVNLGFATLRNVGFSINYKWIQGFLFEGSPQFTGFVEDYSLLDAQVNTTIEKI